jgi:hypothetical protein
MLHFGTCGLDNCPFHPNPDQSDLNNNGIGDICEEWINKVLEEWNKNQVALNSNTSNNNFP